MSILQQHISEQELDALYSWVDELPLSRPKKNINRDFCDGMMMAQTISAYFPKIIDVHNYPATNSLKSKEDNWRTLNLKVLNKIGLNLKNDEIQKLASATPMAVQALLNEVRKICCQEDQHKNKPSNSYQNEQYQSYGNADTDFGMFTKNNQSAEMGYGQEMGMRRKEGSQVSKVDELKEILKIMKQKISFVEKIIKKKDIQIKELEDMAQLGI